MSIIGIADEVTKSVYTLLSADATLLALATGGVHDDVPEAQAYPYVELGETFETKDSTFTADGRSLLIWIHVWSQYAGKKQAQEILARIGDLLDEVALVVTGAVVQSCEVEYTQVVRDPDGRTRHGIAHLRVSLAES